MTLRPPENRPHLEEFGPYRFDVHRSTLYRGNVPVILPRKRMEVLRFLVEHAGSTVRKEEIIEQVWPNQFVDENNLTLQVFKLRRDLEEDPSKPVYILTVPGVGYMLCPTPPIAVAPPLPPPSTKPPWLAGRLPIILLLVIGLLTALLLVAISLNRPPTQPAMVRPYTSLPGLESDPAFAPDGHQLAFSSEGETNNNRDLYLKPNENEEPIRLTNHPEIDSHPVWSPDGRQIAFLRRGELSENTNRLVILSDLRGVGSTAAEKEIAIVGKGLDWSPDGRHFVVADAAESQTGSGLSLLSIDGRETRRLTIPVAGKVTTDIHPRFSPGGEKIAFLRSQDSHTALTDLFLVDIEREDIRQLTFDQRRIVDLDWMPDGRSIIIAGDRDGQRRLWRIPLDGGPAVMVTSINEKVEDFTLSPDGQRLAFTERTEDTTIEIRRLDENGPNSAGSPCLINSSAIDDSPRFSPDGTRLAFISGRSGRNEIWIARDDCRGLTKVPTFDSAGGPGSPRWSPNGRWLAFDRRDGQLINSFLVDLLDAGKGPLPLRILENSNLTPAWSSDGQRIYFESSRVGQSQIWQQHLGSGQQSRVTIGKGRDPVETADGSSLFYTRDNQLWRRDQQTGLEEPVRELAAVQVGRNWCITPQSVYFIPRTSNIRPIVHRFDLRTRQVRKIMELGGFPVRSVPGLCVTPDEKRLAVSYFNYRIGDIKLATSW